MEHMCITLNMRHQNLASYARMSQLLPIVKCMCTNYSKITQFSQVFLKQFSIKISTFIAPLKIVLVDTQIKTSIANTQNRILTHTTLHWASVCLRMQKRLMLLQSNSPFSIKLELLQALTTLAWMITVRQRFHFWRKIPFAIKMSVAYTKNTPS